MRIQFNSLRKRMQVRVSHKIVGGKPKALYLDPGLEAVLTGGRTDVATPLVHHRSRGTSTSLALSVSLAPSRCER